MVEPTNLHNQKDKVCTDLLFDDIPPPPPSPPLLLRQYATWDDESRKREKARIAEVIKSMKNEKLNSNI